MRLLPHASVLPTLLAGGALAAEFELRPTMSVGQFYTDNVNLAPRGRETSEWVTQATPGVLFRYNGAKLKFFATASAEMLYRSGDGGFDVTPQYNGGTVGSMEVLPQLLYFETNSTVSQQNTSAQGRQSLNNINVTGGRDTVRQSTFSPFMRQSFGSEALGELRYTYSLVDTDGPATRGDRSGGDRFDARLVSGPAYKRTTWNLAYFWDRVNYDTARDQTRESFSAGLRHLITPVIGAVLNAGYEDNDYIATSGSAPKGSFWSAGFDWTPTPRTNLLATAGRRYYGPAYSLDFRHRSRLTVWNANYSEQVTTYREQVLAPVETSTAAYLDTLYRNRIPDAAARQQAVQDFITQSGLPPTMIVPVNFFTNRTYIQKTWRGSVGLQGPRHTVLANAFRLTRTSDSAGAQLGAGDFANTGEVTETGGGIIWNWRLTAIDSSNVSVGYSRSEFPGAAREDNRAYLRASYMHQFTPRMSGVVNYHRLDNDSNVGAANYTENQVSAQLQMSF